MILLNLGCGDLRAPLPWVNVDRCANKDVRPDIVADAFDLPFATASIGALFCGHLLEHLPLESVPVVLHEVHRVLRDDGAVCFVGPDYDRALVVSPDPVLLQLIRDGGNRWPGDQHLWVSTGEKTLGLVRDQFPSAVDVPIAEVDAFWPVHSRVGWQFAIVAPRRTVPVSPAKSDSRRRGARG